MEQTNNLNAANFDSQETLNLENSNVINENDANTDDNGNNFEYKSRDINNMIPRITERYNKIIQISKQFNEEFLLDCKLGASPAKLIKGLSHNKEIESQSMGELLDKIDSMLFTIMLNLGELSFKNKLYNAKDKINEYSKL